MIEECNRMYYESGNIRFEYYYDGRKYNREGGLPAAIYYYDDQCGTIVFETYYKDGKVHREDGPARVFYYPNGKLKCVFYYLNDEEYSNKEIIDNWEKFCKMQIFR